MIIFLFGNSVKSREDVATELASRVGAVCLYEKNIIEDMVNRSETPDHEYVSSYAGTVARLLSRLKLPCVVELSAPTRAARDAFGASSYAIWVADGDEHLDWEDPRSEEYKIKLNSGISVDQKCEFIIAKIVDDGYLLLSM